MPVKGSLRQAGGRRVSGGLSIGSVVVCADNTGAKKLKIIQLVGYKGRKRRRPSIGVGDLVIVSVRDGPPDMKGQLFPAVIVRQREPYRRPDGTWIQFEDNAAIIMTPDGVPKGSAIKGCVAREAVDRWPKIASVAGMVV